jgi:RimJ/RimL family protein N-acetyltransferase
MLKRLPDGSQILIRPIRPDDKRMLEQGLHNLSETSVQRRFLSPKPSFSRAELRYLTEVDGRNHVALAAFAADDPDTIIGVARCVRLPDPTPTAEFAIVVGDAFQRRGLGTLLARELATAARAVGIRRFAATMLGDNVAVRRLMSTISAHLELERFEDGLREVVVDLAA